MLIIVKLLRLIKIAKVENIQEKLTLYTQETNNFIYLFYYNFFLVRFYIYSHVCTLFGPPCLPPPTILNYV
jgi:hypothetical protein